MRTAAPDCLYVKSLAESESHVLAPSFRRETYALPERSHKIYGGSEPGLSNDNLHGEVCTFQHLLCLRHFLLQKILIRGRARTMAELVGEVEGAEF